jgi:hypothetical protein
MAFQDVIDDAGSEAGSNASAGDEPPQESRTVDPFSMEYRTSLYSVDEETARHGLGLLVAATNIL